jgi:hypothetical protein
VSNKENGSSKRTWYHYGSGPGSSKANFASAPEMSSSNVAFVHVTSKCHSATGEAYGARSSGKIIADSGSQRHVFSEKFTSDFRDEFHRIDESRGQSILFGTGNAQKASHEVDFGIMKRALVVPTANDDVNLMSLSQLAEQDYKILTTGDRMWIFPPGTDFMQSNPPVLEGRNESGLYIVNARDVLEADHGTTTSANYLACAFSSANGPLRKFDRSCFQSFHRGLRDCNRELLLSIARNGSVSDLSTNDLKLLNDQRIRYVYNAL